MSLISAEDVKTYVLNYLLERTTTRDFEGMRIDDAFDFLGAGIIDSLGVLDMIAAMEKHFQIRVDFDLMDPEEFTALKSFSCYVAESAVADAGSDKI